MRVGLLWHSFFSGNLGVSALTEANISLIKEAESGGNIDFVLFGPRGDKNFRPPNELKNVRYVEVSSLRSLPAIFAALRRCNIIFDIGSGDSFSDIYGARRLAKIAGLKFISALAGRPPVLSPQTIGPFESSLGRFVAARALKSCRHVFARDELSFGRAEQLMGGRAKANLSLATDVAFALRPLETWPDHYPALEPNKTHIGLNVSGLLHQGGYTKANQFGLALDYRALINELIEELSAPKEHVVWLIPHVYQLARTAKESDLEISKALNQAHPKTRLAPLFFNASEAKTFISKMNLLLGARMHATIAAVSSGVACVPMSYSLKFQGLFESLDYPYTIDLKKLSLEEARATSLASIEHIDEMSRRARASTAIALDRLSPYRANIRQQLSLGQGKK